MIFFLSSSHYLIAFLIKKDSKVRMDRVTIYLNSEIDKKLEYQIAKDERGFYTIKFFSIPDGYYIGCDSSYHPPYSKDNIMQEQKKHYVFSASIFRYLLKKSPPRNANNFSYVLHHGREVDMLQIWKDQQNSGNLTKPAKLKY